MKILTRIVNLGITANLPYEEKVKTQFTNSLLLVCLISSPLLVVIFTLFLKNFFVINLAGAIYSMFFHTLGLRSAYKGHLSASRNLLLLGLTPLVYFYAFVSGIGSGIELFFLVVIVMNYFLITEISNFFSFLYIGFSIFIILLFYSGWTFIPIESTNSINSFVHACVLAPLAIFMLLLLIKYFDKSSAYLKTIESKNIELNQLINENQELEHFAYIASHDLNEPIRTIESFLKIIKEEYHDPNNQELDTYFSFIHEASDRMRAMIDGILNYTKLGKDKSLEYYDINQMITSLEQDLAQVIKENNAIIEIANLPTIQCDDSGIRQVFQNLIANAIKFQQANSQPHIKISCQERSTDWEFCVADNGIGIDQSKQDIVFKMFSKLHRQTEFQGHGIGLAFCKKIIEFHQGDIWVESIPNVGSQFYFTIPKAL